MHAEPGRPAPNPAAARFPEQLRRLAAQADAAGTTSEPGLQTAAGRVPLPGLERRYLYRLSAFDQLGRYTATPVYHAPAASLSVPDDFPTDTSQQYGPPCDKASPTALVEVTGRGNVPVGAVVQAWPSASSGAMLFQAPAFEFVRVDTLVSSTPQPVYAGHLVTTASIAAGWVDLDELSTVRVTDLSGLALKSGRVYRAAAAGFDGGVPLYWTQRWVTFVCRVTDATAEAGVTFSWGGTIPGNAVVQSFAAKPYEVDLVTGEWADLGSCHLAVVSASVAGMSVNTAGGFEVPLVQSPYLLGNEMYPAIRAGTGTVAGVALPAYLHHSPRYPVYTTAGLTDMSFLDGALNTRHIKIKRSAGDCGDANPAIS